MDLRDVWWIASVQRKKGCEALERVNAVKDSM